MSYGPLTGALVLPFAPKTWVVMRSTTPWRFNMKFKVYDRPYTDEVEVKLHWETKDKLKKFAWNTLAAVSAISIVATYVRNNDDKNKKTPKVD